MGFDLRVKQIPKRKLKKGAIVDLQSKKPSTKKFMKHVVIHLTKTEIKYFFRFN